MARKTDEQLRLTSEQALSSSAGQFGAGNVVDARYRLQPADLSSSTTLVKIRAVTVQGMEAPALLLHLTGFTKPLLLDTPNREALLGLTGSPVFDEWVGRQVDLHVVGALGAQRIALFPLASPGAPPTPTPTRQPAIRSRLTTLLIVLLVVFLALAAAYWIERGGFIP